MKLLLRVLALALAGFAGAHATTNPPAGQFTARERSQGYAESVVLAKPRSHHRATVAAAEAGERVRVRERFARFGDLRVIEVAAGDTVEATIARLQATGRYEFVEPDHLMFANAIPNDPSFGSQWALNNTGQLTGATVGVDIKAVAAWDIIREAPDVVVAVIDGGVRLDHLDLAPNLWVNPAPTFGDVNGATIMRGVRSGTPADERGHGTHVAGIIGAAGNNGIATTGIAWRVQLMPLKNAGADGASASSDSAACIDYAVAHGAHLINCSFGGTAFSQTMFTALRAARDAGVIVVTSAGNSGLSNDLVPNYPSNYLLDNIVSVGNSTATDAASSSSDSGATVELFAPGTSILSLGYSTATGIASSSGTSMAAPMVTGSLALLKARFPNDSYRQLINRLLRGTELKTSLAGRAQTNGRLNLLRSLTTTTNRPFNDDFAARAVIAGSTISLRTNNRDATMEPGEPTIAGAPSTGTLWWLWAAIATGPVAVDTTGSEHDTVLAVYPGPGTNFSALTPIVTNDDAIGNQTSRVTFNAVAGLSYVIAIAGKNGGEGYTQLNISAAPLNDDFANATPLSGESTQFTARNNNATLEPNEPRILGYEGGGSLWYKWTAPRHGRFQVSAFTTDFDALLAIYTGSTLNNLSLVTANDDTDSGAAITNSDSRCTLNASAGTTYYLQVDAKSRTSRGTLTVSITDSLWQFSTDGGGISSPVAVAPDGTLYFGTVSPDRRVYAVRPDGTLKWTYAVGGGIDVGSPAIGGDGTVYIGSLDGNFTALTPAGSLRWQRDFGGTVAGVGGGAALAADGTIYVHAHNGFLYALAPADGAIKWRFDVAARSTYASPTVAPDGTIYQGSDDGNFYAINPDGTLKWKYETGGTTYSTPALDAAGNIYTATYSTSRLISLTPGGTLRWSYNAVVTASATPNALSSSPALSADGTTVYVGTNDRKVHAVEAATGLVLWTFTTGNSILASVPAVDSNGVVYIGCYDGKLYAINSSGTLKRTWDTALAIRSSPAIFGTTLYVGGRDAKLYAFDVGATAAGGPWPMFGHNVRRLGRALADPLAVTVAPQARSVSAGEPLELSVTATGQGPLTFQWLKDGTVIAGANSASYAIASAAVASAGSYTVRIAGPQGTITSAAAVVAVSVPTLSDPGRLVNLSILTTVNAASPMFTVGTVVGGTGTRGAKPLLIRAAGPSLATLGVTTANPDPKLDLYAGAITVGYNNDWGGPLALRNAFTSVGAFAYESISSKDAAIYQPALAAGNYTVQVSSVGGASGLVIAELYDATPSGTFTTVTPRLINVSVLKTIGAGEILTAGFVIGGGASKQVLIRAIGPTLGAAPFNVAGAMADPKIELFRGAARINENDNWGGGAALSTAFGSVGAFALGATSRDAALVVTLAPGSYTALVTGAAGSSGAALVEVYEVP